MPVTLTKFQLTLRDGCKKANKKRKGKFWKENVAAKKWESNKKAESVGEIQQITDGIIIILTAT